MGAAQFETRMSGSTARAAFDNAVGDAWGIHGTEGYTGTIGEKQDFRVFPKPEGVDASDVIEALRDYQATQSWELRNGRWRRPGRVFLAPDWGTSIDWEHWYAVYNDKWGPAVAIADGDGWVFCGFASC